MSQASASLLVIGILLALAGYSIFVPPAGMEDLPHRIMLPFVLIACAFTILDNLRMRTHMAELIGAIRHAVGRSGKAPTAEAKGKAIPILLKTLGAGDANARATAARQLAALTGADFGEDAEAWSDWWAENKSRFGG
ncbi:MAG: hypothetical protein ACYTGZ_15645 [Planctomycetota bacterium]|jgi:hypothetical protein